MWFAFILFFFSFIINVVVGKIGKKMLCFPAWEGWNRCTVMMKKKCKWKCWERGHTATKNQKLTGCYISPESLETSTYFRPSNQASKPTCTILSKEGLNAKLRLTFPSKESCFVRGLWFPVYNLVKVTFALLPVARFQISCSLQSETLVLICLVRAGPGHC